MAQWQAVSATAFGSVGASYASILTPDGPVRKVIILNDLNEAVDLSFTGGDNTTFILKSGESMILDTEKEMFSSEIHLRHRGVAPTSGDFRLTVVVDK